MFLVNKVSHHLNSRFRFSTQPCYRRLLWIYPLPAHQRQDWRNLLYLQQSSLASVDVHQSCTIALQTPHRTADVRVNYLRLHPNHHRMREFIKHIDRDPTHLAQRPRRRPFGTRHPRFDLFYQLAVHQAQVAKPGTVKDKQEHPTTPNLPLPLQSRG